MNLDIAIVEQPVTFQLHGLGGVVAGRSHGEVGFLLMNEMWRLVKGAKLGNTGINHWVYLPDDRMFVGVALASPAKAGIPEELELLEIELKRHARHLHIGPYRELPQKWQALKRELASRGECVVAPSLEIYGHASPDESKAETTILLGLAQRI